MESRRSCSCTAPSPDPRSGRASSRPGSPRAATRSRCRGCPARCRGARLRDYVRAGAGRRPTRSGRRRSSSAIRSAASSPSTSRRSARSPASCWSPRPGPCGLGPSLWQLSARGARRARHRCCRPGRRRRAARARGGAPGALHRGDAGRLDRRGRRPASDRESPLALLDGADLGPAGLVPRPPRPDDRGARRPGRLRAGHRPLGDRAGLRRRDRARPRRRARPADRPALEEPRLADQRLDRRARPRPAAAALPPRSA